MLVDYAEPGGNPMSPDIPAARPRSLKRGNKLPTDPKWVDCLGFFFVARSALVCLSTRLLEGRGFSATRALNSTLFGILATHYGRPYSDFWHQSGRVSDWLHRKRRSVRPVGQTT